jgi:hypothetical protein
MNIYYEWAAGDERGSEFLEGANVVEMYTLLFDVLLTLGHQKKIII